MSICLIGDGQVAMTSNEEIAALTTDMRQEAQRMSEIASDGKLSSFHREKGRRAKDLISNMEEEYKYVINNLPITLDGMKPFIDSNQFVAASIAVGLIIFLSVIRLLFGGRPDVSFAYGFFVISFFGLIIYAIGAFRDMRARQEIIDLATRSASLNQHMLFRERFIDVKQDYDKWADQQGKLAELLRSSEPAARGHFVSASERIRQAKRKLTQAEAEFAKGAFVAFWDFVEQAGNDLASYAERMDLHQTQLDSFNSALKQYQGSELVPVWSISPSTLRILDNLAKEQAKRLVRVSYQAQFNPNFAQIYELRRNTSTLISGFKSLHEAINNMTRRIENVVRALETTVSDGFLSITSALDEVHSAIERVVEVSELHHQTQSEALQMTAKISEAAEQGFAEIAKHGRFSREAAKQALKNDYEMKVMLQDIQGGKKDSFLNSEIYGTILDPGPRIPNYR